MSRENDIVKSVFYAIVASTLGSAVIGHKEEVSAFLESLKGIGSHSTAFMCIGFFVFISLYFHDEWKYKRQMERSYLNESFGVVCLGWSFFYFQACVIISSPTLSVICGIIGAFVITLGFIKTSGSKKLKIRFTCENVIWIIALLIYKQCVWSLLAPIGIIFCRLIMRWGLEEGEKDVAEVED